MKDNRRLRVGLVQVTGMNLDSHGHEQTYSFLPYSVGLLQTYFQKHSRAAASYEFLLPVYSRVSPEDGIAQLRGADIAAFSAYVWNVELSLEIARRLKEEQPETLIVFGGPQVPDHAEQFLRKYPFVDIVSHGEGERIFQQILEKALARDWSEIPGVSFLRADGTLETHPRSARLTDLSVVPSPYLDGTFDELMRANPRVSWFPLWETNRGCPFACTFCDWGSAIAGKVFRFDSERIRREVEWFVEHRVLFVYCCDANFGMLTRDVEITDWLVKAKTTNGFPRWVSLQSTKNATERSYTIHKLLSDHDMTDQTGITISLQSLDPQTLKDIKRHNISTESFQELQRRFTRDEIKTYTDMIIALPGETYDAFANGVVALMDNNQNNRVQFYNCSILPNAEMGDPEYQRKYGMVSVPGRIIEAHSPIAQLERDIPEYLQTCVATDALPKEDWVRAKVFSWWTEFLHYDRVAQIPFMLLRRLYGVSYRDLLEAFASANFDPTTALGGVQELFQTGAEHIQNGGPEFYPSPEWLGVYWPFDQAALLHIVDQGRAVGFYQEVEMVLSSTLHRLGVDHDPVLVQEAIELNRKLLKAPFQSRDIEVEVRHNIWELYRAALLAEELEPIQEPHRYEILRSGSQWHSFEHFCSVLLNLGERKSSYLYELKPAEMAPAG